MNEQENSIFYTIDGEEYCDEEKALAQLLLDEVLFCNEREIVGRPFKIVDGKLAGWDTTKPIEIEEPTTILLVNCNDLFYWGCADAERLPNSEIGNLYKMHMADKKWGVSKWCCFRRKLRPQVPIVKMMKEEGVWDDVMEALPAPEPS